MTVLDDARAMSDDLVQLRHRLHQHPEIGLDLPWTQEQVLAAIDGLPLEVTTGSDVSSVTAVLRGGAGSGANGSNRRAVLLRGEWMRYRSTSAPVWTTPRPARQCTPAATTCTRR